ncbi:hypothetical protein GIB67_028943 [Kingdonia uniflora]|uniref:Uncharacterized protein n=1 Tax=Kingdonia uniflora TaxID=39325 RepID=A0A7J7LBV9_9MAGN|nr:hypothetical protein GIB67_028943 [Kingdonia uniflora]
MEMNISLVHYNNGSSDQSTIASTRDDSNSTCTDLSLSSFSNKAHQQGRSTSLSPRQHHFANDLQMGSPLSGGKPWSSKSSNVKTACSDSSFEDSATSVEEEIENADGKKRVSVPFIDFLGIGAI